MARKLGCFGATDIGRRRSANEDQFLIAELNKSMCVHHTSLGLDDQTRLFGGSQGTLLAVADGMGGHRAGERASQLAVDSLVTYVLNALDWCFQLDDTRDEHFYSDLRAALRHCRDELQRDAEASPRRRGMGTTLTMAYIMGRRMYIVHAGDSRCYVLRKSTLTQITRDHTMGQLLRETSGDVTPPGLDDRNQSHLSNVLWNVIAADNDVFEPEVYQVKLEYGDSVLLCTDGLTKHLGSSRLVELLGSDDSSEVICRRLIDAANDAGGSDNVTVIVARLCERENHEDDRAMAVRRECKSRQEDVLGDCVD
jgi:protein phosphatase